MHAAAEDEDDPITRWQAVYLEALMGVFAEAPIE
jgi:hypothetical protein